MPENEPKEDRDGAADSSRRCRVEDPSFVEDVLEQRRWILCLAGDLIRDPGLAEDATQETLFEALARAWPNGRVPRSWLVTVLVNRIRTMRRRDDRREARERLTAREDVEVSTAQLVERMELQAHVAAAVTGLPEPYREAVLLRYLHGIEPARIAERLVVPAGTVRSRLARGLQLLREELDRRSGGDRARWLSGLVVLDRSGHSASREVIRLWSHVSMGGVAMKKLALIVTCAVLLLGVSWRLRAAGPERSLTAVPMHADVMSGEASRLPSTPAMARVPSGRKAVLGAQRVLEVAPDMPLAAPGWWLVGTVEAEFGAGTDGGPVTITYTAVANGSARHGSGQAQLGVPFELDVSELFAPTDSLVVFLDVDIDHPTHVTQRRRLIVDRAARQDARRPGGRSVLALDATLVSAVAAVRATFESTPGTVVEGALVDVTGMKLVDRAIAGASGQLRLRSSAPGHFQLVAWERRVGGIGPAPTALPYSTSIELTAGEELELGELRCERGERIAGSVSGPGGPGAPLQLVRVAPDESGLVAARALRQLPVGLVGGAWHHRLLEVRAARDGSFEFAGLGREPWTLRLLGTIEHPDARTSAGRAELTVTPPAVGLFLSRDWVELALEVRDTRGVRSDANVYAPTPNGQEARYSTAPDGTCLIELRQTAAPTIRIDAPGNEPVVLDLASIPWSAGEVLPVYVGPLSPASGLEVVLLGDEERRLESLGLLLSPVDPEIELPWRYFDAIRVGDAFRFEGILPGAYRGDLIPTAPRSEAAPEHCFMRTAIEFDVAERARTTLKAELTRGAHIVVLQGTLPGETPLPVQLTDATGMERGVTWFIELEVPDGVETTTDEALWPRARCMTSVPVPPGRYRLRVSQPDGSERSWSIDLEAGETHVLPR